MARAEAFQVELGAAVRSASPLLISMLAIEGLTLDGAVAMLEPKTGWPARPRLFGPKESLHTYLLRYYLASRHSQFTMRSPALITEYPLTARMFDRAEGGYLKLQVVDHSLEIEARIGSARIETRFGELSIQLDFDLPGTIFGACVGRLLEEIVDHEAWRGRGWRIVAKEEGTELSRQKLVVATGSVGYRMPWAR